MSGGARPESDDVLRRRLATLARELHRALKHRRCSHVHALRILLRRTRAVLWVLRHAAPALGDRKLERKLQRLLRDLGGARELDVACHDAETYQLGHHARRVLRARRRRARDDAGRALRAAPRRWIDRRLGAVAGRLGQRRAPLRLSRASACLRRQLGAVRVSRADLHCLRSARARRAMSSRRAENACRRSNGFKVRPERRMIWRC